MRRVIKYCPKCKKDVEVSSLHYDQNDKEWIFPIMESSIGEFEEGENPFFEDIDERIYPDFAKEEGVIICDKCENTFKGIRSLKDLKEYMDELDRLDYDPLSHGSIPRGFEDKFFHR